MYRDKTFFEEVKCEELFRECDKFIKDHIADVRRQSCSLRDYLALQKKAIAEKYRSVHYQHKPRELQIFQKVCARVQKELMSMEEDCENCFAGMKFDLLAETRYRSEPSLRVPSGKVKEAFDVCKFALLENDEDIFVERCHCLWKNIPKSMLEDLTIKSEKMDWPPSRFDETDLKLKQDLRELRTKVFAFNNGELNLECRGTGVERIGSSPKKSFHEITKKYKRASPLSGRDDLSQVHSLRFTDGELIANEYWVRVLDVHANQLRSKWYFVICPQIEKIMQKRRIPSLHLDPGEVLKFLYSIPENGLHFILSRKDLLPLLEDVAVQGPWLTSWKPQLKAIGKERVAAVLIQSCWRGYWLRRQIDESYRRYIAASVLWYKWLSVKNKREMNATHLRNMLLSLNVARELSAKFSEELNNFIGQPHIVVHVPSLGLPLDIRRTFSPKMLAIYQQSMSLRISFLRNPMSEILYILPFEPTQDYLSMYVDIIDSVVSQERTANRMTFLTLSQGRLLERTHMNLSRILHCSEDTLVAIREKMKNKPAYILPWIVDECDVRISDSLSIPLLGPDMDLQKELLNLSRAAEIIDDLGLPQPANAKDIRDYAKLCSKLAELIVVNTEICLWMIRLNFGMRTKHFAIFLINHISIPFMPTIREVRKQHGDEWKQNPKLREEYLDALLQHLPKVVRSVVRLNEAYSWKDFYSHIQKFGCLLQAIPNEEEASTISVSLFVPGQNTKRKIKWVGTTNKIRIVSMNTTTAFMIPQTSVNVAVLYPNVNKLAHALQRKGYFGYLSMDCYCYPDKDEATMNVLLLNIHPYYYDTQHYIDWIKFVVDGSYNTTKDTINARIAIPTIDKKRLSILKRQSPEWNETTERAAIVLNELYHVDLPAYSWSQLKSILKDNGISYDAKKKAGCHFFLHDAEKRNTATMIVVTSCMKTTLLMAFEALRKLSRAISIKKKSETNMLEVANFFEKFVLKYRDLSRDPCE